MDTPQIATASLDTVPVSMDAAPKKHSTVFPVLYALSFCHLVNDTMQALLPAVYPVLKETFKLSFTEVGMIVFANQFTASLLQPLVGLFTDKRPMPYLLVAGMASTFMGLLLMAGRTALASLSWRPRWWAWALLFFTRNRLELLTWLPGRGMERPRRFSRWAEIRAPL